MKSLWKRAVSLLLTFSMLLPLFPIPAFADTAFDSTAVIYPLQYDENGSAFELGENTLSPANMLISTETSNVITPPLETNSDGMLDLWPSSSNMIADGKNDGSEIPYVYDKESNKWYLRSIRWGTSNNSTTCTFGSILTENQIITAYNNGDKSAYIFDPKSINAVPGEAWEFDAKFNVTSYPAYYIWYSWTTESPENWGTNVKPVTTYSIQYDIEWPEGLNEDNATIFGIKDGSIMFDENSIGKNGLQQDCATLSATVKENNNFTVASGKSGSLMYNGYLIFNKENNLYYTLDGWKGPDGKIYYASDLANASGDMLPSDTEAANDLSAEGKAITFTTNWKRLDTKAFNTPADSEGAPQYLMLAQNNNSAKIEQWIVNQAGETTPTKDAISLNEEDTLYYKATVNMNGAVASVLGGKTMWSEDFANFDIVIHVDPALVIAEDSISNGYVSAKFVCPFLAPKSVWVDFDEDGSGGTEVAGVAITSDAANDSHVIFVPADAITNADGTIKPFKLHVQWISGTANNLDKPMTLTSFGLALKTGEDGQVSDKSFELSTTGYVTGTIDFTHTQQHARYQAANAMLLANDSEWAKFFGPASDPAAVINAERYLTMVLINSTNAYLSANSVKATYRESEPGVYKVTLVRNGGTILKNDVTQYTAGEKVNLPFTEEEITREGYIFQGWYTDQNYSDDDPILSIEATDTGDKIYYAKWEKKPDDAPVFSVFLIKNGGTFAEGKQLTQYTAGEDTPLPTDKDITREGYTFKGWYRDEELTDGPVELIEAAERGCKVFFARWEPAAAPAPSEPAQSVSDDGSALLGLGIVLAGGAAALTYHYRAFLPIWKYVGIVKLADEDGTPVPNATVTLFQDGEEVKSVTTNDDGYFETRVPKGDYEVVVTWERDGVEYTERTEATVDRVAGDIRPQEIILDMEQLPEGMA